MRMTYCRYNRKVSRFASIETRTILAEVDLCSPHVSLKVRMIRLFRFILSQNNEVQMYTVLLVDSVG
jgi:hypothetical protein